MAHCRKSVFPAYGEKSWDSNIYEGRLLKPFSFIMSLSVRDVNIENSSIQTLILDV